MAKSHINSSLWWKMKVFSMCELNVPHSRQWCAIRNEHIRSEGWKRSANLYKLVDYTPLVCETCCLVATAARRIVHLANLWKWKWNRDTHTQHRRRRCCRRRRHFPGRQRDTHSIMCLDLAVFIKCIHLGNLYQAAHSSESGSAS